MPRTNIDYSKTTIYKICCKDLDIKEIYVGHTTDMRRRKTEHRRKCNNENSKVYNFKVYQFIRENGGWDNWDMIEVERYNAIDGYDATKRERYWIEELKATLNSQLPTRTIKEYYELHKEILLQYQKEYREINKEIIVEDRKKYRDKNKEILAEKSKKYRENNSDKLKEYEKNRKNKEERFEKLKEKITCECGFVGCKYKLSRHKQTKRHIELINNQIENILKFIECFL
jgi:hypothetical protein